MTLGGMMIVGIVRLAQRYPRGFWIGTGAFLLLIPAAIGTEYLIRGGFHPGHDAPPAPAQTLAPNDHHTAPPPPRIPDVPHPAPVPAPWPAPPLRAGTAAPPTLPVYERYVAQYGADHVFRITLTGISNPVRDMAAVRSCFQGQGSLSLSSSNDTGTCILGASSWDFATCAQHISFGKVIASDAAARTMTVAIAAP